MIEKRLGRYAGIEQTRTLNQINNIYKFTNDIIECLDDVAIKEILTNSSIKDIDEFLEIINQEVDRILHVEQGAIKHSTFGYLDRFADELDDTLKKLSLNYFIINTLPSFEMNWHHIEWGNLVQYYDWLNIIAARDHSKSWFFSLAYPLWRMYGYDKPSANEILTQRQRLSKEGMIITNEYKLGRRFLRFIREEIDSNEFLREKLKPKGNDGWGSESLTCKNGAMLGLGSFGTSLRGPHPGWIIVDDFLDKSCLYSVEQRDKFKEVFHAEIMNMLLPKGQVIVVGTPFHEQDLYAELKSMKDWKCFEYPSIFPDGNLLWENRYDLETLLKKKETQGSIKFSREILVKPISSESTIFPFDVIKKAFLGMDEYCMASNIVSYKKKFSKVVIGCDFAISSSIGADYTVFTVIGVDELENYHLIYFYRERGADYNKQIMMLKQLNSNFRPDVIMAEDNAFQKVMIDLANDSGLNVVPHTTGINKYDLDKGLPALSTLFSQCRIKFPRGDAYSKDMTDIYVSELTSITWSDKKKIESVSEHDDTVYSLWIAILASKYVNDSFSFDFL